MYSTKTQSNEKAFMSVTYLFHLDWPPSIWKKIPYKRNEEKIQPTAPHTLSQRTSITTPHNQIGHLYWVPQLVQWLASVFGPGKQAAVATYPRWKP